jgi:hypothetical protein
MIVVSTIFSKSANAGETAIGHGHALNNLSIDFNKVDFTTIKEHSELDEAKKFHEKTAKTQKWRDTQVSESGQHT